MVQKIKHIIDIGNADKKGVVVSGISQQIDILAHITCNSLGSNCPETVELFSPKLNAYKSLSGPRLRETVTETYPLPRVEDLLTTLAGRAACSKLDLKHAYQQVVLDEETKQLVTINAHKRLYKVK